MPARSKKATDDVAQRLQEHSHGHPIAGQVAVTIQLADRLSDRLDDQIHEPTRQLGSQAQANHFYSQLSDQLQAVEQSL